MAIVNRQSTIVNFLQRHRVFQRLFDRRVFFLRVATKHLDPLPGYLRQLLQARQGRIRARRGVASRDRKLATQRRRPQLHPRRLPLRPFQPRPQQPLPVEILHPLPRRARRAEIVVAEDLPLAVVDPLADVLHRPRLPLQRRFNLPPPPQRIPQHRRRLLLVALLALPPRSLIGERPDPLRLHQHPDKALHPAVEPARLVSHFIVAEKAQHLEPQRHRLLRLDQPRRPAAVPLCRRFPQHPRHRHHFPPPVPAKHPPPPPARLEDRLHQALLPLPHRPQRPVKQRPTRFVLFPRLSRQKQASPQREALRPALETGGVAGRLRRLHQIGVLRGVATLRRTILQTPGIEIGPEQIGARRGFASLADRVLALRLGLARC